MTHCDLNAQFNINQAFCLSAMSPVSLWFCTKVIHHNINHKSSFISTWQFSLRKITEVKSLIVVESFSATNNTSDNLITIFPNLQDPLLKGDHLMWRLKPFFERKSMAGFTWIQKIQTNDIVFNLYWLSERTFKTPTKGNNTSASNKK